MPALGVETFYGVREGGVIRSHTVYVSAFVCTLISVFGLLSLCNGFVYCFS